MFVYCIQRGFTLIELLVTLALVAILMGVAAPSFVAFQRNAELSSLTNTLLASMNAARGEAMKRGRNAMISPIDNSKWENGWVVYVDMDSTKSYSTGDVQILSRPALPIYISVNADGIADETKPNPRINFKPSGFPDGFSGNLTFTIERNDVPASQVFAETRRLKIHVTGRVRICKPTSNTDINCTLKDS